MSQERLEYEEALRTLLGLAGKRVLISVYGTDRQVAAQFSGRLQHANQSEWGDKLYQDIGIGPAPEALFFSVNPFALLPPLEDTDTEQLYGFAIAKHSFDEAHKVGQVLFIDLDGISFVIRDADAPRSTAS
jgi:hypothetical protein